MKTEYGDNEHELLEIIRNSVDPIKVLEYAISLCIVELRKAVAL